jgi:hypothetical protein
MYWGMKNVQEELSWYFDAGKVLVLDKIYLLLPIFFVTKSMAFGNFIGQFSPLGSQFFVLLAANFRNIPKWGQIPPCSPFIDVKTELTSMEVPYVGHSIAMVSVDMVLHVSLLNTKEFPVYRFSVISTFAVFFLQPGSPTSKTYHPVSFRPAHDHQSNVLEIC